MTAVLIKELREHAKWAALACGIVLVWTYIRLVMHETNAIVQVSQVLEIMGPLTALVLGIAQGVFDTRPDNWAFTVHRPIRRGTLFTAKSIAGLLLMSGALLAPIALFTAVSARPGHASMPFHWRLSLAPLSLVVGSLPWYFAGLIVTLRRARWYGSRLLPVGLALVASSWVSWAPEAWRAMLGLAIALPCVIAAAWGAFAGGGAAPRSFLPRFGLGASILPACLLLFLLFAKLGGGIDGVTVENYYNVERTGRQVVTHFRHDNSGTTFSVTGVDGRPLPEYEGLEQDSPRLYEKWLQHWCALTDDRWIDWPGSRAWKGYRSQASLMLPVDGGYPPGYRAPVASWLNLTRGVIELYDNHTHLLAGTIGPDGFAPAGAEPNGHFPDQPLNITGQRRNHTLAFASIVYWMELDQRRVRPIFTASADDPVLSAGDFDPDDTTHFAAIMTSHRLHVVDPAGENRVNFSAPLEFDHGKYSGVALARLPANGHLLATAWWEYDGERTSPVFEFAMDGTLVRHADVPTLPMANNDSPIFATVMGLGAPVAAAPFYRPWGIERLFHIRRLMGPYWRLFVGCMTGSAIAGAIASAALAWFFGFSIVRAIAWTCAGALLGLSAVVLLLCLNDWPVRERCPGCGRLRRVNEVLCRRCRSPHAPPATDGREIFEPCDSRATPSFA